MNAKAQEAAGRADGPRHLGRSRAGRSAFEERHCKEIEGRLLCFDRLELNGTLQSIQSPSAIFHLLQDAGLGAFDLKVLVQPLADALRANAERLASEHDLAIEFIRERSVRKADLVAGKLATRGHAPGLVCILSAMESCSTFAPRRAGGQHRGDWIKAVPGYCLHYYFYFIDAELGLMHVRVPTWMPYRLQFNFNGHHWLATRLRAAGLNFTQEENAFSHIQDWEQAQALSDKLPIPQLEAILQRYGQLCCPVAARFGRPYLSIAQAEVSLDIAFKGVDTLAPLCEGLCREAMLAVRLEDMAGFFSKTLSAEAKATSHFRTLTQNVWCVRHHWGAQGLKIYNKGSVLRLEATSHDITFYRHYRKVAKLDGTSEMNVAPLKKQLLSLADLFELMGDAARRYLKHVSALDDPHIGRHNLEQITRPKRDEKNHSWRGINFFLAADITLILALQRGEGCLSGWTNKRLRHALGGNLRSSQAGRLLRRLREHALIKRIAGTFKYHLTTLGRSAIIAALKIKQHLVIPTLQTATAT